MRDLRNLRIKKRITGFIAAFLIICLPFTALADTVWPLFETELHAASACVMDADTGEILYEKDMHSKRYPASITKLLTALIVCERCELSEEVTFSLSACANLESGAVTVGTWEGDVLTVEECLDALLLKSANEVANALAEHVAGSVEDFCVLMNERAAQLGCVDSDFHNPNGLTNEAHVTSAYDMALIARACLENETLMGIEAKRTSHISTTSTYPGGLTVTIGHKMLLEGDPYYDSRAIAGKTGFTSASGNTLVTMAEDNGRRLCAVVLKDSNPEHYVDTKALLDYGFDMFSCYERELTEEELINGLKELSAQPEEGSLVSLEERLIITVPEGTDESLIEEEFYEDEAAGGYFVRLSLPDAGVSGSGVKISIIEPETPAETGPESTEEFFSYDAADEEDASGTGFHIDEELDEDLILLAAGVLSLVSGVILVVFIRKKKREEEHRRLKLVRERRARRLMEGNISEEEFRERLLSERNEKK